MNSATTSTYPASAAAANTPQISFLIPMYNGVEFTRVCVRTLAETVDLRSHEVILINDCSTDGTAKYLAKLPAPTYRVVSHPERGSYAIGMNRGVRVARGEMLALLNNDLVFRPGWLPPMLRAFEKFPKAGFVGNVQINPRTKKYDHMGVIFHPHGLPDHFGRHFSFRLFRGYTRWPVVTAACCLIKKSVFLAGGGFDEVYKNGCEDVDLCLKLEQLGYENYVANESIVGHYVSSSEGRHRFNSKNEDILLERWRSQVQKNFGPRDQRLLAANYFFRFLTQPWRYNGRKLRKSLITLLKCGH